MNCKCGEVFVVTRQRIKMPSPRMKPLEFDSAPYCPKCDKPETTMIPKMAEELETAMKTIDDMKFIIDRKSGEIKDLRDELKVFKMRMKLIRAAMDKGFGDE
jgi:hypothetical protein